MNYNSDNNRINTENQIERRLEEAVKEAARKRKKRYRKNACFSVLSVVFLALIAFTASVFLGDRFASVVLADDKDAFNNQNISEYDYENQEMRGVWVASVLNINYPSEPGLSEEELKSELDDIVKNAVEAGLNAVFFQVRPTADALYPSEIFPYSKYLTGTQGKAPENGFDSLAYLLERASEHNLKIHAWVNPYRVTMYESDEKELCESNPAVKNPEYTVKYADGKTYLNPGIPEVRELVINGVKELAQNYPDLSGIHFDDYFYPYPSGKAEFDDEQTYQTYGNGMAKDEWRRNNVNTLIENTYNAIKEINPDIQFGVSPFGIWANESTENTPVTGSATSGLEAYNDLYCDALAWAKGGYVDYLIPQIYWSFNTSSSPFDNVARWWNANLDGTDVDMYIGHAAYKVADYDKNELGIQVEFSRNLLCYKGSVFYGYEDIKNNTCGLKDKLKQLYLKPVNYDIYENMQTTAKINQPQNNYQSTAPTVTLVGQSDVNYPVSVNGKQVSRTKNGLFSVYDTVTTGINVFTLEQNGAVSTHNINYKTTRQSSSSSTNLANMQIIEVVPAQEAWVMTGDTLTVSCVAPAKSKVTAKIGGMSITLKPTLNSGSGGKYAKEIYIGEVTPASFAKEDGFADLGVLTITATLGSETATVQGGFIRQMGQKALVYAEVINDYSHLKTTPTSSFYNDYTPVNAGMRDYIKGRTGSFYQLKFGGYISESNVKLVEGVQLNKNRIFSVNVHVNGTETVNNKNNFTDVVFGCLENAPANAVASASKIDITFYNTDSSLVPQPVIENNPLIYGIVASAVDADTLVYTIMLKNELNAYGYNIVYENGNIILRMNNPQSLSANPEKPLEGKTIVVDAGHGGADSGALGCGYIHEAQLNFEIATYLKAELENLGATVLMTRTQQNQTVSLEERMAFLIEANPDLAISVHQNSIASSADAQKVRGYLGLYGTEAGKLLAKSVSSRVSSELNRYERPYAYQKLAVARNHRFPSTLCEMCFISNVEEYQWSITPGNTLRSAQAIALGVIDYYKAQEVFLAY